jgi:hypothetical protein
MKERSVTSYSIKRNRSYRIWFLDTFHVKRCWWDWVSCGTWMDLHGIDWLFAQAHSHIYVIYSDVFFCFGFESTLTLSLWFIPLRIVFTHFLSLHTHLVQTPSLLTSVSNHNNETHFENNNDFHNTQTSLIGMIIFNRNEENKWRTTPEQWRWWLRWFVISQLNFVVLW